MNQAKVLLTIAVALLVVALSMFGVSKTFAQDPNPQTIVGAQGTFIGTTAGITGTTTTDKVNTLYFGIGDCYSKITVSGVNTTTVSLQHSADGTNWVTGYSFPAVATDTVAFTRTVMYGQYMRLSVAPVTTTIPVTSTVTCVLKNN